MIAEVEKTIQTVRGTVNVDVYAFDAKQSPLPIYLCECKYWSDPVSKDVVHSFRTVLTDFGASCGFLISKSGFQSGAIDAAEHANVRLMNWSDFESVWTSRWIENYLRPRLFESHLATCDFTDPLILDNDWVNQKFEEMPEDLRFQKQKHFHELRIDPSNFLPAVLALRFGAPWHEVTPDSELNLPLGERLSVNALPSEFEGLRTMHSLREFGDTICRLSEEAKKKFDRLFTD